MGLPDILNRTGFVPSFLSRKQASYFPGDSQQSREALARREFQELFWCELGLQADDVIIMAGDIDKGEL
jgi:hypothetical protein